MASCYSAVWGIGQTYRLVVQAFNCPAKEEHWQSAEPVAPSRIECEEKPPLPVACLPCNGNALFGGHQTALSHAKGSGQISQVQDLPIRLVSTGRDGQQIWVVTEPQLIRVNAQGIVVNVPFARKRVAAVAAVFE